MFLLASWSMSRALLESSTLKKCLRIWLSVFYYSFILEVMETRNMAALTYGECYSSSSSMTSLRFLTSRLLGAIFYINSSCLMTGLTSFFSSSKMELTGGLATFFDSPLLSSASGSEETATKLSSLALRYARRKETELSILFYCSFLKSM